jgi:ssDNA-binding replication factor A large subunit
MFLTPSRKLLTADQLAAKLARTSADRAARAQARVDIGKTLDISPFDNRARKLAAARVRSQRAQQSA